MAALRTDSVETPSPRRSTLKDLGDRVVLTIPAPANWPLRLFLPFWLCGWCAGEYSALAGLLGQLSPGHPMPSAAKPFVLLWLVAWTAGGAAAIAALAWAWAGQERIEISDAWLTRSARPLPWPRRRTWELALVRRLRISTPPGGRRQSLFEGPITFDFGSKTVRMGAGLQEAEARDVLDELAARFPALAAARDG